MRIEVRLLLFRLAVLSFLQMVGNLLLAESQDTLHIYARPQPIHINENFVTHAHQTLIIHPGVHIIIGDSIDLIGNGSVHVLGTRQNPVIIESGQSGGSWRLRIMHTADALVIKYARLSNIHLYATKCDIRLEHVTFVNDAERKWNHSFASLHGGSLYFNGCRLFGNQTGEGIVCHNIKDPLIQNCLAYQVPDAIELIKCRGGRILNNHVLNSEDDGIDLNGCDSVNIMQNLIYKAHDRGIEIGRSHEISSTNITIKHNVISNCEVGIHLMEGTEANLINNTLFQNQSALVLKSLNNSDHSDRVRVINNILWSERQEIQVDNASSARITYSLFRRDPVNAAGNITGDPLFVAPWDLNFNLQAGSPALNAADTSCFQSIRFRNRYWCQIPSIRQW